MAFLHAMSGGIKSSGLPQGLTYNEKGAISHSTTGDARLNYFAKVLRDSSHQQIVEFLGDSWVLSPLDTMKLIAQKRDCRGGSGERKVFYESMRWVVENYPDAAKMFLPLVPTYGTWKDGFFCFCDTSLENDWLQYVANQLKTDHDVLHEDFNENEKHHRSVTLCAKWVPSEGSSIDRKFSGVYDRLVKVMGLAAGNKGRKELRQKYLSPLREFLDVVERLMCGKDWQQIKYKNVPSVAMNRLRKAFDRNDSVRFKAFLADVAQGKQKINASQLFPHDMVKHYMGYHSSIDQVIEEQWKAYVKKVKELGELENAVVLSDVSSSMSSASGGLPMQVSIALGLLISTVTKEPFRGLVITFQDNPTFHKIDVSRTLQDQVKQLQQAPWGGTTNFQSAFDLILKRAVEYKLKKEDMPKTLVVISDMQFDQADCGGGGYSYYGSNPQNGNFFTNFETIKAKYRKAGYDMPRIVFWNVAGRTEDFPVTKDEYGVAMVSGFSPCHLKYLTTGQITTPYELMREAIDSERYKLVDVPEHYKQV